MKLKNVLEDGTLVVKPKVKNIGIHTLTLNGEQYTYTVEPGKPSV